jgi:hypothetical protein
MNEERRRILNLRADKKITAEEADQLMEALSQGKAESAAQPRAGATPPANPKFLRVQVEGYEGAGKVNVRVPLDLVRAGMRLAALLPATASDQINKALKENGVDIDISKVKPENLEELVDHLRDVTVNVDGERGERVRVYCE